MEMDEKIDFVVSSEEFKLTEQYREEISFDTQ